MKRTAVILSLISAAVLAGCGHSAPSAAACKAAMTAEYAAAVSHGTRGTEPAQCDGLSAAQLQSLAGQVIASALAGPAAKPAPGRTATPEQQQQCQAAMTAVLAGNAAGVVPSSCQDLPGDGQEVAFTEAACALPGPQRAPALARIGMKVSAASLDYACSLTPQQLQSALAG